MMTRKRTPKGVNKVEAERLVCKRKLDALELEESRSTEDRFSLVEKKKLLEVYESHGFQIFQDIKALSEHFPNRSEGDLSGLLQRLKTSLKNGPEPGQDKLNDWQSLCSNLMGNFARDKRVNMDGVFSDILTLAADKLEEQTVMNQDEGHPNYPEFLRSFAQLLGGRFPDKVSDTNAIMSMTLFEHIKQLTESSDLIKDPDFFEKGLWLQEATKHRYQKFVEAKSALDEITETPELDQDLCQIFLELPKMRRITEFLNPLRLDLNKVLEKL